MNTLTASPTVRLDYHLVHTIILRKPRLVANSLGVFRNSRERALASFAVRISPSTGGISVAAGRRLNSWDPSAPLQGRLHCTQIASACRFIPQAITLPMDCELRTWASAKAGLVSACHCGLPNFLNSQHKPKAGRPKPTPGTSSMCPLTDF